MDRLGPGNLNSFCHQSMAYIKCLHLQSSGMRTELAASQAQPDPAALDSATLATLQAATRVLAGVALRSLDVLDGAVTLPQFRMLAVLADLGRTRSVQVARALGLEASTVTRVADRLVAAGYIRRGREVGHRGVVTLELTSQGLNLVDEVAAWRAAELSRILGQLSRGAQAQITAVLAELVRAAGTGYGLISRSLVPV